MYNIGMKRLIISSLLLLVNLILYFLFRKDAGSFFPAYRNMTRQWMKVLSSVTGLVRFSLWDIILLILFVLFIYSVIRIIRKKDKLKNLLLNAYLIGSVILTMTVSCWMLNHYSPELSEEINLYIRQYSQDELYQTTEYYLLKAAEHSVLIERDAQNHIIEYDFDEMADIAGRSYCSLEDEYSVFSGSSARVKKLTLTGDYLLYNDISGIFIPVTAESCVPGNIPDADMPFAMAHEAAHRLCLAGEDEANFAAFMACTSNDDVRFRYSGYYNAFSYCFSSLYRQDKDSALQLYEKYENEGVALLKLDRRDTSEAYRKYDSPLSEISDRINDTYLKTFGEEEGIRSYGLVTDYLIAWYLKNN